MTSVHACRKKKIERCKQRNIKEKQRRKKNKIITMEQASHVAVCMRDACVRNHMHLLLHGRCYHIHVCRYHK